MTAKPAGKGRRGLRLGSYDLSSPVKTWDQGAVYRAQDATGQEVAVKLLSGAVTENAAALKKLQHEIQQASRCRHENVLRVYELGEANGTWFLASELVEGVFLGKYIAERGPVGQAKALRWLGQMAKAIDHFHRQGLVPDTSPGGFLVSGDGKLKLVPPCLLKGLDRGFADLDLAAPEQRGQPQPGDIRAALYTLGGTLHFILTGEPPSDPLELEVSDHLLTITERLLTSNPEDRYQKPGELLADMDISVDEPEGGDEAPAAEKTPQPEENEVPAADEEIEDEVVEDQVIEDEEIPSEEPRDEVIDDEESRRTSVLEQLEAETSAKKPPKTKSAKSAKAARADTDEAIRADRPSHPPEVDEVEDENLDEEKPQGKPRTKPRSEERGQRRKPSPYLLGGLLAAIVLAGGVAIFLATRDDEPKDPPPQPNPQGKLPNKVDEKPKQENQLAPLDIPALQKEFEGPWATPMTVSKDPRVLRVSRLPPPEGTKPGTYFNSLAAACAAAAEKVTTIIEVHDNGPLFELPITVSDRSLMITGGPGYQPMLVWDLTRWKAKDAPAGVVASFLSVERGELWLGGLEIALQWPDDAPGPASLIRMHNSELLAWNCTFSSSGLSGLPVSVVRVEADQPGKRCRLSNCFARGPNLIALDLKGLAPEVMLDQCLVAGKELPLVRSLSSPAQDKLPTVRLIRSTLVGERGIVQVRPSGPDPKLTALRWMCWDSLLARAAKSPGGALIELPKDAEPANYQWKGINSQYAGWDPLLAGPERIEDLEAWKKRWNSMAGWERTYPKAWAEPSKLDRTRSLPAFYTPPSDLQILATFVRDPKNLGKELYGCDLNQLPWSRSNWLDLGYQGFKIPDIEVLRDSKPPAIPVGKEVKGVKDERYYGGKVDLNKTDIVQHLQEVQKKQELGGVIVLHLSGSGTKKIRPLLQRNRSIVLYFEPPEKGKEPLVLVPEAEEGTAPGALLQLEGGSLEIIGGDIRFPDFKTSKSSRAPHYLIHVAYGNLRIHGTRLQGPPGQPPDSYWGLMRMEGYGSADRNRIFGCTIHESVLVSPRVGLHVSGIGARLRLEQNLIVTGGDALHFQPGANPPYVLNIQCALVNNTIAARQSAVYVQDMSARFVGDPIVLESKANVFMNPYQARDKKGPAPATMVLYQGTALPRGVLAWQSRGDVFDNRLEAFALPAASDGLPPRKFTPQKLDGTWRDLWGAFGTRGAILDRDFKSQIDLDQPKLDQLAYPNPNVSLGADFKKLKIKN